MQQKRARRASSASGASLAPPGQAHSRRPSRRDTDLSSRKHSLAITGTDGKRMSTASIGSVKPRNSQFGLLNISTPVGRQSVMSTSSKRSRRGRQSNIARRISICSRDARQVGTGADPHKEKNGWQIRQERVVDRISCLFNCHTMADVLFRIGIREIPAHKFILAIASPVFYQSLFENRPTRTFGSSRSGQPWRVSIATDGTQTPGTQSVGTGSWSGGIPSNAVLRVAIDHYPFDAFFEFLRWIYTDDVMLSVSNVSYLIFMADEFKVTGLGERCFEFLRTEIRGDTVLRILAINRTLISKAVVREWKEVVEQHKLMQEFKSMSLAERRHHLQNLATPSTANSRMQSRAGSARSSVASLSDYASVVGGMGRASTTSGIYDIYGDSTQEIDASFDAVTGNVNLFRKQNQLFHLITLVSEELNAKCWKCVREHTDAVITCSNWTQQPLRMIKAILRLDVCNVPEIALFRAMNEWADKKCKSDGLPSLPEQRREALGEDTICLVRFPLLTLEQIQWEVVPTGLLSFKDIQSLQGLIAHKSSVLGKFSSEPRNFPISEMVKKDKRLSSKVLSPKTITHEDLRDLGEDSKILRGAMVPTTPVYNTEPGDEVDAMLGSYLLRGFVEQTTEEHDSHLAAFEAGAKDGGEDMRAILCHSPTENKRPSILGRRSPNAETTPPPTSDPHQQKTQHLSQMLMFTPSWLAQEIEEEASPERPTSSTKTAAAAYSKIGDIPGPQDFTRLSEGLYYFRGHQVLDMRIENGETMVYEHDMDDDAQSDNSFGLPSAHDLKMMKSEEAMREELGIAGKDLPKDKVTLSNFLLRQ
mmetsp:Transcript_2656/g.4870  ORF Transcript_2656/g.4870 Transcript_2656/m.4870 type:complete len:817 (+) Transcript_2656:3-2453(+)